MLSTLPKDLAMLRLVCLLMSFSGAPAACTPATPALSASTTALAPYRSPEREQPDSAALVAPTPVAATVTAPAAAVTQAPTQATTQAPAAAPVAPATAPRPARVQAPSWQQRLPGMFR